MGRQIARTAVSGAVLLLFLPLLAVALLACSTAASEGPNGSMVASALQPGPALGPGNPTEAELPTDHGRGIATDGVRAYVTGQISSTNIYAMLSPPPRTYDTVLRGASDAFVARVDTDASGQPSVVFFTHLGGASDDFGNAVVVDRIGTLSVTGQTFGGFPVTPDAFQSPSGGGGDAFVRRLNTSANDLAALISASYLGGSGTDQGNGIALSGGEASSLAEGATLSF